jgi:hypothetical protein
MPDPMQPEPTKAESTEPASKHSDYVVTELKMPEEKQKIDAYYNTYAKRILWLDENVVPSSFHINTAWYLHPQPKTIEDRPHVHDSDEIIGFFGNDPEDPYNLHGEVELWMEDEKMVIDRTALVFVPAGMVHCPLVITRVDRPIFHFTTVTGHQYLKEVEGLGKK